MNLFRRRSDVFVVDFNPFQSSVTFLYPLKTSENLGGIEMGRWTKMS